MNEGLIPRRYAKALLKVAVERHDDKKLYEIMRSLCDSFVAAPELEATLANPFIDSEKKMELLATAAGADKSVSTFFDFIRQYLLPFYLSHPLAPLLMTTLNLFPSFSLPSWPDIVFHIRRGSGIHNGCGSSLYCRTLLYIQTRACMHGCNL